MSHKAKDGLGNVIDVYSLPAGDEVVGQRMVAMEYHDSLVDLGLMFGFSGRLTLANNAQIDFQIVTPAAPAHIEFLTLELSASSAPLLCDLYEGAIVSANGTNVTTGVRNYNRQSSRATTLAMYQSPTVTDVGANIHSMLVNGDKTVGGGAGTGGRLIMKPAERYLMRLINQSGASATVGMRLVFGED